MLREKVLQVDGHKCELPLQDDLISLYISEGAFVQLRRKIRSAFLVDPSNVFAKSAFKSTAHLRWEEARHLRKYFYMIHPFSSGRRVWEMIMMVVYAFLFILMPIEIVLIITPGVLVHTIFLLNSFCLIDIILCFFTGYYSKSKHDVVLDPRLIAKRYILRLFVFDVVSSLPYNMYIFYTKGFDLHYIKYLYCFKLSRLPSFLEYMKKYCIVLGIWDYKVKPLGRAIIACAVIWWSTAYVFLIYMSLSVHYESIKDMLRVDLGDYFTPLLHCCWQVVRTFLLISISNVQYEDIGVDLFYLALMFFGMLMNLVIFVRIVLIYQRTASGKNKYHRLVQEIDQYMTHQEQPTALKKRVERYIECKLQKNVFTEQDILGTLSTGLQQEVKLHNLKRLVEKLEFFKNLPQELMANIVSKLKRLVYLPNDLIVRSGTEGTAMYFILNGSVAVYSITNKEICHLEDGDHFGEISLVIRVARVASVRAISVCEILRLSRKDYMDIIEPFPAIHKKIKDMALMRFQETKKLLEQEYPDEADVMLRSGRRRGTFFTDFSEL